MKKITKRVLIGWLLVLLLTAPLSALAQDDDWVDYEEETGLFSISHPADWFLGYDPTDLLLFSLANSEALLEEMMGDEDAALESGDQGIAVLFVPAELAPLFLGEELTEDMTPDALAAALGAGIASGDAEGEPPVMEEPEVVELEDGSEIGVIRYTVADENIDGILVAFQEEGVVYAGIAAAYTGEFDEEFRELALEILGTFELDSDVLTEMINMMMGGGMEATEEPSN
jgi:hypothetical protein